MTDKINRRDFLKLAAVGAGATAILTGCGPASRYVVREPYTQMPEYTYNGQSTYYATTCRECPAGCQRMLDRNYAPGFMARLHQKDTRIVLETAQELGLPLPGAERVTQYIEALVGRGDGH